MPRLPLGFDGDIDDMKRIYAPTYSIVTCRGRKDGLETNVRSAFTEKQLSEAAPLKARDEILLRKAIPPEYVQRLIALRIAAAQRLKYGVES